MARHFLLLSAAIFLCAGLMPLGHAATVITRDGERYTVDNSTAADAKKKIEAAGYSQVSGLKKGLDSFWHGSAVKNGAAVHVVLAPDGTVSPEE